MEPGIDYIGVGVGALIVNEKDETLLMKRGPKSRNLIDYWNKPGGVLEFGENPDDAVYREVFEEMGVEIEILGKLESTASFLQKEKQH
ncbi:MAG: NUDIX hydrolase [Patescibacteria group bacterium]